MINRNSDASATCAVEAGATKIAHCHNTAVINDGNAECATVGDDRDVPEVK